MASTRGFKAKALPDVLTTGLARLGYRLMPQAMSVGDVPLYRHPRYPHLRVLIVASNLPGSTDVLAEWTSGQPPQMIDPDRLLAELAAQVGPNQPMARRRAHEEESSD